MGALFSFVACNKEELVKATQTEEKIDLVNGRLKFSSRKAFDQLMGELSKQQTPKELDKWEAQWPGFVSMRKAFNQITEQDIVKIATNGTKGYDGYLTLTGKGEDRETVRNVDNHVLATLVNKDGIVLIGDKAYKFRYGSIVKMNGYTDAKIAKFQDATATSEADGVEVLPVKRKIMGSKTEPLDGGRQINCEQLYWHGGSLCCRKRLLGELYATEVSDGWNGIGGYTKHQRKSSGVWWSDQAPEVRFVLHAVVYFPGSFNPSVIDRDVYGYDDGIVEYSYYPLDSNGNGLRISGMTEFNTYHSSVCDDGRFRECYLSYF